MRQLLEARVQAEERSNLLPSITNTAGSARKKNITRTPPRFFFVGRWASEQNHCIFAHSISALKLTFAEALTCCNEEAFFFKNKNACNKSCDWTTPVCKCSQIETGLSDPVCSSTFCIFLSNCLLFSSFDLFPLSTLVANRLDGLKIKSRSLKPI